MISARPVIFITNDDGFDAPGLRLLSHVAAAFGQVVVLAPQTQQSGKSSSVTSGTPISLRQVSLPEINQTPLPSELSPSPLYQIPDGVEVYAATGTPVDCCKLAFYSILKERRPSLVLSGINHGSNSSINVVYSGTMGATIEGCMQGVPSVGFSLVLSPNVPADYSISVPYLQQIIPSVLAQGLPAGICLNVNFPAGVIQDEPVWCRQSASAWNNEFSQVSGPDSLSPDGPSQQWLLGGSFENTEPQISCTDESELAAHHVSVVPIRVDMTATTFPSESIHQLNFGTLGYFNK